MKRKAPVYAPLKIGEVARLLGWSTQRARRFVDGLERREPGLVTVVNGQRHITVAALREVVPEFATKPAADVLEELNREQTTQKREIDEMARAMAEFRAKSHQWFRSLGARMNAAEKMLRDVEKAIDSCRKLTDAKTD